MRRAAAVALAALTFTACAACTAGAADPTERPPEPGAAPASTVTGTPDPNPATSAIPATTAPTTTTTAPPFSPTTTTTPRVAAPLPTTCRPESPRPAEPALAPAVAELRAAGGAVGASVWVDGVGEVVALDADQALIPASNQKLLTAATVLELLPGEATLDTVLVATGPVVDGVVRGDLVLVGAGDPTLTRHGLHSLDGLAGQVRAVGITGVEGRLLVDDTRFDAARTAPGWPDAFWPNVVGPLSALPIDRNKALDQAAFADPPLATAASLLASLQGAGVTVAGGLTRGPVPPTGGIVVAAASSAPLRQLVGDMVRTSDNLAAELLLKEVGRRRSGQGTTAAGVAAAREVAAALCLPATSTDRDGSGLSREDARSARGWRRLLQSASAQPWWPDLDAGLPVAGRSGTLAGRLTAPATAGRVHAKTGSTAAATSLSGYLIAASGRRVWFSVVINQHRTTPEPAIDRFVTALATSL